MTITSRAIIAAAALSVASPLMAAPVATADSDITTTRDDDDRDFPWGLLGLLGLAGLLGRKRNDDVHRTGTTNRS